LDNIRSQQSDPIGVNIGYLDYVTDDRVIDYYRPYVGQTTDGEKRIILDHIHAVLLSQTSTLHYYIVWRGNGHRSSNFITLWAFPQPLPQDEIINIQRNFLELVFCYAFRSLRQSTLEQIFGNMGDSEPDIGLNVLCPLFQGYQVTSSERLAFRVELGKSSDPEIREWVAARKSMQENKVQDYLRDEPIGHSYSARVLELAVGQEASRELLASISKNKESSIDGDSTSVSELFQSFLSQAARLDQGHDKKYIQPVGSFDARMGFVLDVTGSRRDKSEPDSSGSSELMLPWGMAEIGLNPTNSLVWT
jgi:hypothetical protein